MTKENQAIRERLGQLKRLGWNAYEQAFSQGYACLDTARGHFLEAEALARSGGDPSLLIGVLSGLGAVARASGQPQEVERALHYYWEEVDILRELGHELEAADLHAEIEAVYRDLAALMPDRALRFLKEGLDAGIKALEMIKRHQNRFVMARVGNAVADICQVLSDYDTDYREFHLQMAADLYRQGLETWSEQEEGQAVARMGLAEVYLRMGKNLDAADVLLDEALGIYTSLPGQRVDYQIAQIHTLKGQLMATQGKPEDAKEKLRQAITMFRKLGIEFPPRDERGCER